MLTPRQELLLGKVIDGFSATGHPVSSKALATEPDVDCGPSTVRNELAVLEELGLLAHPHTSAGRVPTDAGYRYYVDRILPRERSADLLPRRANPLGLVRREIEALDDAVKRRERLMLGLRLDEPVALATVGDALDAAALRRLQAFGLAERRSGGVVLTERGRFLGGGVTAELVT